MSRPRSKSLPQTSVDLNSSDASPKKREQLKAIRERKGLTQLELADLLGTTPLNVSRWERGVTRPTPYFRSKLTKIFGKSEEELGLRLSLLDDETSPQTPDLASSTSPSSINSTIQNSQNPREEALKSSENSITSDNATHTMSSSSLLVSPVLDSAIPDAPAKPIIGREQELSTTKERLYTGGKAALTALNGLPGVGKTALSITIANDPEVREHFRDGVLWAALGPQPDLTIIMSRWSKQLGIPEGNLPEESDVYQWADEVNRTIGVRRMLIVIDDAWELDHALRLRVGGSNCAHLLTTRFPDIARNFIEESDITTLYELNDEESMKLLQRLAPNAVNGYEEEALALIRAVGGLPLALTLAGNYLRSESGSKNSDIIKEAYEHLSEATARLELDVPDTYVKGHPSLKRGEHISLQTLFAVTDRRLSEEQRAAFYALSVFPPKPADFSKNAALAIAQCGSRELHALHETGLLEDKSENIYTLHQTIADYARLRLMESGEQQVIQDRLITYALDTIKYHRKDYDILEREQSIILHALDTAYELNRSTELIEGATGFTPFLLLRALYDHAKTHLERAHEHALKTKNRRGIISTYLYLGELNLRQNHYKEANNYLEEGLKRARKLKDKELICDLLDRLGGVAWKQGKNKEAQIYLEEGLKLARELEDVERICNLLKALALVFASIGEYEQEVSLLKEGIELAKNAGHREQLCNFLINSGVSLSDKGDYSQAENLFEEGLSIAKNIGHKEWISALLSNLGDILVAQGKYELAEQHFRKGLETAHQINNREWLSLLYLNLGMVMREQQQFDEAQKHIILGIELAKQIDIPYIICNGLYEYGLLSLRQHYIGRAGDVFLEMFQAVPKGDQELAALARYGLAQVAKANNNTKNATQLAYESKKVLREIGHSKADEVEQWMKTELRVAC